MSTIHKQGKNYMILFTWNGKRYHRSLGVSNKKYAEKRQAKLDFEVQEGTFNPKRFFRDTEEILTLSQLKVRFIKYLSDRKNDYTPRTIDTYKYNFDQLIKIIGDRELKDITPELVEDIQSYLNNNYKPATHRQRMSSFRIFFNKAKNWGFVSENPFQGRVPKRQQKEPRYLREDEIVKLKDYFRTKSSWLYDMVFLTINTGLRKKEASELTWDNIDLTNEQIILLGKGNKERVVPLNDVALEILSNRKKHIHISGRVFWEAKKPYAAITQAWKRFRKATKIYVRFHDLRSTYASWYLMNGGSIERLSKILGHSSIQITQEVYGSFSSESLHRDKNLIAF